MFIITKNETLNLDNIACFDIYDQSSTESEIRFFWANRTLTERLRIENPTPRESHMEAERVFDLINANLIEGSRSVKLPYEIV